MLGLFTSYQVNIFFLKIGRKEGMPQSAAQADHEFGLAQFIEDDYGGTEERKPRYIYARMHSHSGYGGIQAGSWASDSSKLRCVMPRMSSKRRWRTLASRRSTCSQTGHHATIPGPCTYRCASAKRLVAPQYEHCPAAAVISSANMLPSSPPAALPSR